jgi:hypothetical protein
LGILAVLLDAEDALFLFEGLEAGLEGGESDIISIRGR